MFDHIIGIGSSIRVIWSRSRSRVRYISVSFAHRSVIVGYIAVSGGYIIASFVR